MLNSQLVSDNSLNVRSFALLTRRNIYMRQSDRKHTCMVIDDDPNSLSVIDEHIMLMPKLNLLKYYLDPV